MSTIPLVIPDIEHHTPDDFAVACDVTLYSNPVNRALGDAMVVKSAPKTAKTKTDDAKAESKEDGKEVNQIAFPPVFSLPLTFASLKEIGLD